MPTPPIINQYNPTTPYKLFSPSNTILNTYTPSNLTTNLALWLDAAPNNTPDSNGNYYNIDLSGSSYVFKWRDKSPNKYDANSVNGLMNNAPQFDGTSGIVFSNEDLNITQGLYTNYTGSIAESIFIVCKPTTVTQASCLITSDISGGRSAYIDLSGSSPGDISGVSPRFFIGSNANKPILKVGSTLSNFTVLAETVFNSPLSTFKGYINAQNTSNITNGSVSTVFVNSLSNVIGLGNFNISQHWGFNGTINEILIYSNTLSDSDRQKIESYLGYKWGITLNSQNPYYQVIYSNYRYPLLNCNYFTISSVFKSAPINTANYPLVSNYFTTPPYLLKPATF